MVPIVLTSVVEAGEVVVGLGVVVDGEGLVVDGLGVVVVGEGLGDVVVGYVVNSGLFMVSVVAGVCGSSTAIPQSSTPFNIRLTT